VFENRVLRKMFGPEGDEVTGDWEKNCIMRNSIVCTLHQILLGDQVKENVMCWACSVHEGDDMRTKF
jgi:invasion protein IalB